MIDKILIVGFGSIGKRHLKIAETIFPNADIRILRSGTSRGTESNISDKFLLNIEDALNFCPQISVIANPAPFHLDVAIKLAKIGSNLLIEKPIAESSSRIIELMDAASSQNVQVLIGYNLRYLSSLQYFRRLIQGGELGRIFSVRSEVGQYLPSWRKDIDYRDAVSGKSSLGGGVLLELSHEIDYLVWIFGRIKWVSAIIRRQSELEIDVEDVGHLLIEFDGVSSNDSILCSLDLDFLRHNKTRFCMAIGEKATLRWNGVLGLVEIFYPDSEQWITLMIDEDKFEESYVKEWNYFLSCIGNGYHSATSILEGRYVLDVVESAKVSNRLSGKRVSVEGD